MADEPLPAMAPNSAQVTTVTAPSPPRTEPMKELTKRTSCSEIPLAPMSDPATTNSGRASSAKLPSCW